jgi:hypothetical protein
LGCGPRWIKGEAAACRVSDFSQIGSRERE